ncbi:C-type lectin domain family 4 member E [Nothobranchius furzeri]|uniref:CD209 antigen-like protein E n=1 Tax=Nothobranchius furzeri TaxID=105023 RepID=A0A9D3B9R8_NOTFU|nr:CD209 antigen-like protein E [Nothobranchius furzeri]KAF7201907.1 CD209 antigen-like protein E [Nothobranchius furzeri]
MSSEGRIYQDLTTEEVSHSHPQILGQGPFATRGGFPVQHHRLVILGLGLLNAALLIAAAVIGIYCAKATDLQISSQAATPLILEMKFLRNHTDIIRAKAEAEAALAKERAGYVQMKLEVKQKGIITDNLMKTIETLQAEKTNLQSNKTVLEENCDRCPPGWQILKNSCYFFSENQALSKKNWFDSRADCISKGGDLLVINNMEEQILVNDNFRRLDRVSIIWWLNGFWIGLTDLQHQGKWVWINNVTEESPTFWRRGQPNIIGAQSGNCTAFLPASTLNAWYNANCQQYRMNWVCEMEPRNR